MATPFTGGASAGLAAAACSAMVGAAIGAAITFTNECLFAVLDLAGGLAGAGITYGLTGEATFNILNISDFGAGAGSGLLEVTFGKKGFSSRIGTGGIDISAGTLRTAYAGLKEADKVLDWKYGTEEQRSTLNAINMLGYTKIAGNVSLSRDIWNGTKSVEYGDTGSDYGNYTQGDTKIRLSKDLLGKGREASAKLATVMSHEGTHLYGNRIEGVAHLYGSETYSQLNNMFELEADNDFSRQMLDGIRNPENWKENTGDVDHWEQVIQADGSTKWKDDGKFDFTLENGTVIKAEEMKVAIEQIESRRSESTKGLIIKDASKQETNEDFQKIIHQFFEGNATGNFENILNKIDNFIIGTKAFADASVAAKKAIASIDGKNPNAKEINSYLTQLKNSLYAAQESGLLVKNPYGAIDTTGLVETNGSFVPVQLGPNQEVHDISTLSGLRMLYSEKEKKFQDTIFHTGIDLRGIWNSNIVSGNDSSSFSLTYSDTFGLRGINSYSDYDHTDLLSHMEASPTIKAYISNFGKEGVSIDSQGNLDGIKKGTVLGNVGNTGNRSNGEHLDWIVQETNSKGKKENISPLSSNIFGDYLATATRTYEAATITGLPLDYDMKSEDAYNRVKSYYNWAYTKNRDLNYAQKLLNSYTTKYADEIWKRNLQNGVPGYYSK